MNGQEVIRRTIEFDSPGRIGLALRDDYQNDIVHSGMSPHVDQRPPNGYDEWGSLWENIGVCKLGEVKKPALPSWDVFPELKIPDVSEERRWHGVADRIAECHDRGKFVLANGISLYERLHFLRGLQGVWTDIYTEPDNLVKLLDILADMNEYSVRRYADAGADGYFFCDDWGLQNSLMISPEKWREFWKPRYRRVYSACHKHGLKTFLHSCGYIVDILDDLIECGLDVIQMDQQQNMGLERLRDGFRGRLTFWCPVDIQNTMARGSLEDIRRYAKLLTESLGTPEGGFIAKWYGDPKGAGHSEEAIRIMSQTFMEIAGCAPAAAGRATT